MASSSINRVIVALAATAVLAFGPGAASAQELEELTIMAPASPGGGWDGTSRAMQQALQEADIVPNVEVVNVPGAGGTIGLAQFANAGPDQMMVAGLVMVGAILTQNSPVTLDSVAPIARLIGEYEVIVVPSASEYQTLGDLIAALKEDPGSIAWAGGSAGGADHVLIGQIAQAVGVPPEQTNYIAHAGGGEALAALFSNDVAAGVSGYAEWAGQIESGELRALAISAPERLEGVDIPTLKEQGVELEFVNWRGVFGPGNMTDEERQTQLEIIDQMVQSEAWQQILEERSWINLYLPGDEFAEFLQQDRGRIETVLKEVGLVN